MYSVSEIVAGVRNPALLVREANRRLRPAENNEVGIDIFAEDWDTLVILDACRYDYFERCCDRSGTLETRRSRGSATPEWVAGNFEGKRLLDVVYVSGNGWYHRLHDELGSDLHAFVGLYGEESRSDVGTVPPSLITEEAIRAHQEYPNKRHVVHYVQPHKPYVREADRETFGDVSGINMHEMMNRTTFPPDVDPVCRLREAYEANLRAVLSHVWDLVDSSAVDGRVVVSADHGELLGERSPRYPLREFGHPRGIDRPELVEVPWFVPDSADGSSGRRRVVADEPDESAVRAVEDVDVEANLRDLGYL